MSITSLVSENARIFSDTIANAINLALTLYLTFPPLATIASASFNIPSKSSIIFPSQWQTKCSGRFSKNSNFACNHITWRSFCLLLCQWNLSWERRNPSRLYPHLESGRCWQAQIGSSYHHYHHHEKKRSEWAQKVLRLFRIRQSSNNKLSLAGPWRWLCHLRENARFSSHLRSWKTVTTFSLGRKHQRTGEWQRSGQVYGVTSAVSFDEIMVDEPISQCQCSYLLLVAPPGIFKPGRVPLLLRNLREQDVVELRGVPRQVRGAPPVPRAGSCWVIWWDFLGKRLFINWNFAAAQWWWRISQSSGAKTCTLRNANRPFT